MISERLKLISNYINPDDKLADIGCDHGYLAILALNKGVEFVQLIDNKIGPLNNAKNNINSPNCVFTLSSGIHDLEKNVDTVAICGMGGELIVDILNNDLDIAKGYIRFILQPNRNEYELRKFLNENNFSIIDEDIIFENDKYYEIIISIYNKEKEKYSLNDLYFGPILRNKKSPTYISKWTNLLNHYESINNIHPTKELSDKIKLIQDELNK